ncbi:hypothetical protein GUJ93_ZPchr0001g32836 [Zizania palustris]|uniref:Uncharacterized protein n=1 Tax=Zizania palustris TaxID=103762 RepID=A0A8J5RU31_ZIZPA|nr:hypothetical protein GUJ93_ZPchr0001g32836 [Zizania palustris]
MQPTLTLPRLPSGLGTTARRGGAAWSLGLAVGNCFFQDRHLQEARTAPVLQCSTAPPHPDPPTTASSASQPSRSTPSSFLSFSAELPEQIHRVLQE